MIHGSASEIVNKLQELEREISETKQDIAKDPIIQLHRKIFQNQIEEVVSYVKNQPEYRDLSVFKPLVEISSLIGSDLRWCLAAALMSLIEWYLKTWLTRNSENSLQTLKNKTIDELISKIEDALRVKKINFKQLILSDLAGKRHFRNKVIHELTTPHESDLEEITLKIKQFVNYMESSVSPK